MSKVFITRKGQSVEEMGRRKLSAILMADAVGYSRLMGRNEVATVAAIKASREVFRKQVEGYSGRVVNTPGDSILAEFGGVIDALTASIAIQKEISNLNSGKSSEDAMLFRIGISIGEVVSEQDAVYGDGVNVAARLESLAKPGGVVVSGDVRKLIGSKLDVDFDFMGEQHVKNIRDSVPVFVVRVSKDATEERRTSPNVSTASADAASTLAMQSGPTIAVLPFNNIGSDPEQEYFSDGLTEQIISELTQFPDLNVLGRNTTFQFKGKAVEPEESRKALGADYIIEGSVRRGSNRVRVTAKLLDTANGSNLWAETYDRDLTGADLLDLQDDIAAKVVAVLADAYGVIRWKRLETLRARAPADLSVYEAQLRVTEHFYDKSDVLHLKAREGLEQSLKRNPNDADLWAWYAIIVSEEIGGKFNPEPEPLKRMFDAANRAIAKDRNHALAHVALALTYYYQQNLDRFLETAEKALALNRNRATTMVSMGGFMIMAGLMQRGIQLVRNGFALNPAGPGWFYQTLCHYHCARGEFQEALSASEQVNNPGDPWSHLALAICHAHLGRLQEARAALDAAVALRPDAPRISRESLKDSYWNFPELLDCYVEGLRKAGVEIDSE